MGNPVEPKPSQLIIELREQAKNLSDAFWHTNNHKQSKALADRYYAVKCKLDILERMHK